MDQMRPTPRNALMGLISDKLNALHDILSSGPKGFSNPGEMLANALGLRDIAATADRMSYGLPITSGAGYATQMLPETRNALLTIAPMAMPAKAAAPAVKAAALRGAENLAAPVAAGPAAAQRGAIVYHGSPHKFDVFDSSKIGTGEGAQAYGHGLYLAESPEVAGSYQKALSTGKVTAPTPADSVERDILEVATYRAKQIGGDLAQGLQYMERNTADPARAEAIRGLLARTQKGGGSLYKVDLPDSAIARMLDWDKPLSQQAPEVQQALSALNGSPGDLLAAREIWQKQAEMGGRGARSALDELAKIDMQLAGAEGMTGTQFFEKLANGLGTGLQKSPEASMMLRKAGIPGIRYLDGGSRGAGTGTSNYVVFPGEENILRILERNGQPIWGK